MFSHVMVGTKDVAAAKKFYDAVFATLGIGPGVADPKGRYWWRAPTGNFGVGQPIDGKSATSANGGTIGFTCQSPEVVKAFHDAGVANGGKSIEDPPGPRGKLTLAYLRDPDGNKLCALHRG
jgi:catechol 2,3-dioxygenase-like lactoylglutathione lyase family enzyme